ncbi:MAG: hypothetical protein M1817_006349 [Caeruleum heppii]|nr:MAG: hypothetical protein M1817_006349 [Caeruleum heppii]
MSSLPRTPESLHTPVDSKPLFKPSRETPTKGKQRQSRPTSSAPSTPVSKPPNSKRDRPQAISSPPSTHGRLTKSASPAYSDVLFTETSDPCDDSFGMETLTGDFGHLELSQKGKGSTPADNNSTQGGANPPLRRSSRRTTMPTAMPRDQGPRLNTDYFSRVASPGKDAKVLAEMHPATQRGHYRASEHDARPPSFQDPSVQDSSTTILTKSTFPESSNSSTWSCSTPGCPHLSRDHLSDSDIISALIPRETHLIINMLLYEELIKGISPKDEEGYIYLLIVKDHHLSLEQSQKDTTAKGLFGGSLTGVEDGQQLMTFKVGRSKNVGRRMAQWTAKCKRKHTPHHYDKPDHSPAGLGFRQVSHAAKVERLILIALGMSRSKGQCVCPTQHQELFDIEATESGINEIMKVVRHWVNLDIEVKLVGLNRSRPRL